MPWTFAESRDALDPALADAIAQVEAGTTAAVAATAAADSTAPAGAAGEAGVAASVHVLAARSWLYPLERQRVAYRLSRTRPCTLVETFIYKASCLPEAANAPIDIDCVSDLLGLDRVFIEYAVNGLAALGLVMADTLPAIRFTKAGQTTFAKGCVIEPDTTETLTFCFDRKFGAIYAQVAADSETGAFPTVPFPALALLDKTVANRTGYVDRAFVLQVGETVGETIEPPGSGQAVAAIVSATVVEPVQTLMSEVWTWNGDTDRIDCHVWDHARSRFSDELAAFIRKTPGAAELQVRRSPAGGVPDVRWRS